MKLYFGTGLFAIFIHSVTFYSSFFCLDMSTQFLLLTKIEHKNKGCGKFIFPVRVLYAFCKGGGGGYFIPYKSGEAQDEIRQAEMAVGILGGRVEENITFTLPGSDFSRCLVKIRKEKAISGRYPRKAGIPSKEPL